MGFTTSVTTYQQPARKYTDADIKKNIDELFNNAKTNNFSEASYSINDLDNIVITDVQGSQSGGIKFNSSMKRYLRHNIDKIQQGGNNSLEEISDMSEFQRIKEFLVNDMKNHQTGGDFDVDDIVSTATIGSPQNQNLVNFLSALKGGNDNDLEDDEDIDEVDLEDDEDADEAELENDEDADDDAFEDEEDDISDDKNGSKKKSDKKSRKVENFDEDKQKEEKEDCKSVEISETSEDGIIRNPEEHSATSFVDKSSELNILPFYSSDSSINKHPYIKNRIH